MIYSSVILSGLLIIYYIIFIMSYNLFIILITIKYIEEKSNQKKMKKIKKKLGFWTIHLLL